jgi:hypothetical protein
VTGPARGPPGGAPGGRRNDLEWGVTWEFSYVAALIVGLALAAVTGLIRELRPHSRRHFVLPNHDLHAPLLALLGRRLAVGLILVGAAGFALLARRGVATGRDALAAAAAGVLGLVAAFLFLRRPCSVALQSERATVVRDIQPGGYGQVRIRRGEVDVVMAARSADDGVIPAGAEVEVVDCSRSVLTVRRRPEG